MRGSLFCYVIWYNLYVGGGQMFIENYTYKDCSFKITKEGKEYWARCFEISAHSDDLEELKQNEIPMKYHSHRVFKL